MKNLTDSEYLRIKTIAIISVMLMMVVSLFVTPLIWSYSPDVFGQQNGSLVWLGIGIRTTLVLGNLFFLIAILPTPFVNDKKGFEEMIEWKDALFAKKQD